MFSSVSQDHGRNADSEDTENEDMRCDIALYWVATFHGWCIWRCM